ncbi:MAG: pilin, partial [Patescibacteria group bacterium]
MFRYCPLNRLFQKAAFFAIFFVLLSIPILPAHAAGLDDYCEAEICDSGLVCTAVDGDKICKGGIGYITDNPDDCSPELILEDSRCQLDLGQTQGEQLNLGESAKDIRDNIRTVINVALGFLGILGVIMLIYAGVLWMFSAGREEQVLKAKKTILWTVAGLMIITTSWTITSYILGIGQQLGGGGGGGGGDNGGDTLFPPGGVVESFKIIDVASSREQTSPIDENLYRCSALDTIFNNTVLTDSFQIALTGTGRGQLRLLKDNGESDYNDWDSVSWPEDVNDSEAGHDDDSIFVLEGRSILYQHFMPSGAAEPRDSYLFGSASASSKYAILFPRAEETGLKDTWEQLLADCIAEAGCHVESDQIVWEFIVGTKDDEQPPELMSAS